jgi:ABC-type spermidine/putrescine transport system permease subunit I
MLLLSFLLSLVIRVLCAIVVYTAALTCYGSNRRVRAILLGPV